VTTSILERLLAHLEATKKAKGQDSLLTLADFGQAVRELKRELPEIHARAVKGAKISRADAKAEAELMLQFYKVVKQLEMSRQTELERVARTRSVQTKGRLLAAHQRNRLNPEAERAGFDSGDKPESVYKLSVTMKAWRLKRKPTPHKKEPRPITPSGPLPADGGNPEQCRGRPDFGGGASDRIAETSQRDYWAGVPLIWSVNSWTASQSRPRFRPHEADRSRSRATRLPPDLIQCVVHPFRKL
jgi:hypothetical protein